MMEFNNFNPNIKFIYEFSEASISFLDLNVKLSNGKLQTSMYVKPTDRHQYLQVQSSHPKHTKRSIVYSQTLRVSRACSQEEDYKNYCNQMKSWFLKRSYPEHLFDTEMRKVKFKSREKPEKSKSKGVPFVVTYHPSLYCLHKIIRDNTYLLYMNEEVKNLFLPGPMLSFRGARKLSSYLVIAKLHLLHRKVGSKKCAKNRCEVCDYVTNTFTSTVTGESFKINHQLNCDGRCIIYLLPCKQCQKQYTGENTDDFRYRWNNYKSNSRKFDRKESCMQKHLYRQFSSTGHRGFLNDVSVTLIDKMDGSDPKKREDY